MPRQHPPPSQTLSHRLRGRRLSQVVIESRQRLRLEFADGTLLHVSAESDGLTARIENPACRPRGKTKHPTERQFEYLAFIARYIERFGRAPAESDMQRHFLVSAPSIHEMMKMLERRGFITRQPGVARSIRLCLDPDLTEGLQV